jgi:hypothetical protein
MPGAPELLDELGERSADIARGLAERSAAPHLSA